MERYFKGLLLELLYRLLHHLLYRREFDERRGIKRTTKSQKSIGSEPQGGRIYSPALRCFLYKKCVFYIKTCSLSFCPLKNKGLPFSLRYVQKARGDLRSFHIRESARGEEQILLRFATQHFVRKTVLPLLAKIEEILREQVQEARLRMTI